MDKLLKFICFQPLAILPFILFLIFFYKWHQLRNTPWKNLPPSPPKLPILGNIHQLGTHPHRSLRSMSEKYGDLMMIQLGSVPTLVVSSASAAREIMMTHDITFANRPMSKKGEALLYNYKDVVGAPYGEYWRQMKSIFVLNLLSNKRVRSFRSVRVEEETTLLVEKIREEKSSPVNLSKMFSEFANDTICRVAFGRKYAGKQDGIDFNEIMTEFNKLLADFNIGDFIPWLAWIDRFNGWDAKVNKIAKKFDQFLETIVKEHQDNLDDRGKYANSESDEKMMDFVDVLMDVERDQPLHSPIDRDSIKALILDMFSAGTDTTSTLLEWVMTELIRHPRAMKELQKEVREITGEVGIKEDDLESMKYLKAVIKETLRLHLPVPSLIPRQSTQDTKIHGYNIPAKTGVIVNGWAIHRNPLYWDEPEKFNPERFMNSPTDFKGNNHQFIPFGAGRRMCPGISFAMASSELVLANLVNKFNWELPDGAEGDTLDMSESFGINMHRNTPLLAVATCDNSYGDRLTAVN